MDVNKQHIVDQVSLGKIVLIRDQLLQLQAQGKKVYRFESGDPSFDIAPHIQDAIQDAVKRGKTHYTPNAGIPELRKAITDKLARKNGIKVATENIFVTNGAMNGLYATFVSLLDPGDEVLLPEPMWTEIAENIKLGGGIPAPVYLKSEENYEYQIAALKEKITEKTKALFINYPHNPTGAALDKESLLAILNFAKEHDLWIISDEAYEDVLYPPHTHNSPASLLPDYAEKIISIFSFSKSYAMSGLRLGYVVTTSPLMMSRLPKVLRCTINGTNSVAQWAAVAALNGDQQFISDMQGEYKLRRDTLYNALKDIPDMEPFLAKGTFYIWVKLQPSIYSRLGVKDAEELSDNLAKRGIGSTPGNAFGPKCEDYLRFAFSCATEMVQEGSAELKKVLTEGFN